MERYMVRYYYDKAVMAALIGFMILTVAFGVFSVSQSYYRAFKAAKNVQAALEAGHYEAVLEESAKVLAVPGYLVPDRVLGVVYAARCKVYLDTRRLEDAAVEAAGALKYAGVTPYYYLLNGLVAEEAGRDGEAASYYQSYLSSERETPDNANGFARARSFLAGILPETGNPITAGAKMEL